MKTYADICGKSINTIPQNKEYIITKYQKPNKKKLYSVYCSICKEYVYHDQDGDNIGGSIKIHKNKEQYVGVYFGWLSHFDEKELLFYDQDTEKFCSVSDCENKYDWFFPSIKDHLLCENCVTELLNKGDLIGNN